MTDLAPKNGTWQIPLLLLMLGLLLGTPVFGAGDSFPAPRGAVNDFAGIIDAVSAQTMENLSREVLQKTGASIVVAVLAGIGDNDPDDYANRLYQAWGIGDKGQNKGVLIFLTLKERKIRIETGYGLEGILPDGLTGEIIDNYVLPDLKAGQYGSGLAKGVAAVASVIAKDAHVTLTGAPPLSAVTTIAPRPGINIFVVILIIIVLVLLVGTRPGRELLPYLIMLLMSGGGRGGGPGGFGGGGFGGFGGGLSGGGGASRDF